jgi:hypothetical protein
MTRKERGSLLDAHSGWLIHEADATMSCASMSTMEEARAGEISCSAPAHASPGERQVGETKEHPWHSSPQTTQPCEVLPIVKTTMCQNISGSSN